MKKVVLIVCACLPLLSGMSCYRQLLQQPVVVDDVQILDYGIYETRPTEEKLPVTTAAGETEAYMSTTENFVKQTDSIPATLGTSFGFRYVVTGTPQGKEIELTYKILHPPMTDAKTGRAFTEEMIKVPAHIRDSLRHGYRFDTEEELLTGRWLLEIWYGDKTIAGKSFYVVRDTVD